MSNFVQPTMNGESIAISSSRNVKGYVSVSVVIAIVVGLYYLLRIPASFFSGPGGPSGGGGLPAGPPRGGGGLPAGGGQNGMGMFNIWPLWGTLSLPTVEGIVIVSLGFMTFVGLCHFTYKRGYWKPSLAVIALVGFVMILATNLAHGWVTGVETAIGGSSEIYSDIPVVVSILDFISNFTSLQPTLSLHAQTQPPGAVIAVYLLYIVFQTPDLMALGLAAIAVLGSAFFMHGICRRLFDERAAKFATLLYLVLPAVQVYYLANIYAIVATIALGTVYFYLHENPIVSFSGTTIFLFAGTFLSFLFIHMILALLLFEALRSQYETKGQGISARLKSLTTRIGKPVLVTVLVASIYGLLLLTLGFNYVDAFLYASSLENPNGFMLLSSPTEYLTTRVQDTMDIVIFFGPVLSYLAYRGLRLLREDRATSDKSRLTYYLVAAALVALLLLFLTGAPKKGETARICMFVLPFLLMPVMKYMTQDGTSNRDRALLLIVVFAQAVIMQLVATYLW